MLIKVWFAGSETEISFYALLEDYPEIMAGNLTRFFEDKISDELLTKVLKFTLKFDDGEVSRWFEKEKESGDWLRAFN